MTRSFSILAALALLAGCSAATQQRIDIAVACTHEAGPQPYPEAGLLGLAGYMMIANTPKQLDYENRIATCKVRRKAEADALAQPIAH